MDIRMPGTDGLEATRRILSGTVPDPPRVLMLTTFDLDRYVYAALTAGASGFLLKNVTPEHLVAAVRLARTGDALLSPAITRRLIERFVSPSPETPVLHRDLAPLTPRELQVLRSLATGLSNAELAAHFRLSEATVKTHVARILAKLRLRDRAQAVVVAYETGLIVPGSAAGTPPPRDSASPVPPGPRSPCARSPAPLAPIPPYLPASPAPPRRARTARRGSRPRRTPPRRRAHRPPSPAPRSRAAPPPPRAAR